ncbi:unnamed protein product [Effrenium voratum]|uniref:2Fe-2S ferredoxin-type domain-containing protein n=1 Tax=Effrenium voratum TaxID=2562239 RepID=A0AA36ML29_9DINO|nr:unnamed protein product [Effrenium voratum]
MMHTLRVCQARFSTAASSSPLCVRAGPRWRQAVRPFCAGDEDVARAHAFVLERGYSPRVADGIVDALRSPGTGIHAGQVFAAVQGLAGRWEVGEDAGLQALAKSVEQELSEQEGKTMVRFRVQPPDQGEAFECEGFEGMSLKDIAEFGRGRGADVLKEYIECACSGVMACSTCHVYVDEKHFQTAGEPEDAEQDMLELAFEPRETSRLGCQLRLRPDLAGMTVTIPGGANNLFDHIPFE